MKKLILTALIIFSVPAMANQVEGTLILKGSIKTKVMISGIKTTCRARVEKVKNLMEEDSYGNPAYKVRVDVSLSGREKDRRIAYDKDIHFNNLFVSGSGTIVRDLEYASPEGAQMKISPKGRILSIAFPFQHQLITCAF